MIEIKYPESKTSDNILTRHSEGKISLEEINLYNFLASTFPEQVIETLRIDGPSNYVTEYNEDILILLFTVAKLFGSSKEVIKDLDYAYNVGTLKSSNKTNTNNLLLLLADQVNFNFLEGQSLEELTTDAKYKSDFIENYGAIKRRRGTIKALEIVLDLFKNYIIETGVLEEFRYSIEKPSEADIIDKIFTALNDGILTVTSWDTEVTESFENGEELEIRGPAPRPGRGQLITFINKNKTWYNWRPANPNIRPTFLTKETEFLLKTPNEENFKILLAITEPGKGTWKVVNPFKELFIILQDYDMNTFVNKTSPEYIEYNNESYIKLKQDHFLYKMIMDIKPAGVVYNIILNYIATILYTQEQVVAYENQNQQYIKPKLTFSFDTNGGTPSEISDKAFEAQSERFENVIQGISVSKTNNYFEYWEDSQGRELSIFDSFTANETLTAIWYPRKKATIRFWQRDTGNNNANQIGSDVVLYGSRQDQIIITPNMVPTPASYDTYTFNGWVDSEGSGVPLNSNYVVNLSESETTYDYYTTYAQNPRLMTPAIVSATAETFGPTSNNLRFHVTVRNTDAQATRLRVNIDGDIQTTPNPILPQQTYAFSRTTSYTASTKPATGWATVWALSSGGKPDSLNANVQQSSWVMTGVAREPKFDLKIRAVNTGILFNDYGISKDILDHEKVLGGTPWFILAEAKITSRRDWRNINTYIKVGSQEMLISEAPQQIAYFQSWFGTALVKQIRIAGAVNQAARNLNSDECGIETRTTTGNAAPTVTFGNNSWGKQVMYYYGLTGLPNRIFTTPEIAGSSSDNLAYIIPIIKYTSKAFLGQTRWRAVSEDVLKVYPSGYGRLGNQASIYLDADGPSSGNFPDTLDMYYIAVTIDKNLVVVKQDLSVYND